MSPPTIFISYSRKDEAEKDILLSHFSVLQGLGWEVWSDDRIGGGMEWETEICTAIATARVAVLLITANFLTSDFIRKTEVPGLLRRSRTENLPTFPIIAKDCAWRRVDWLTSLNVRPRGGKPIWGPGRDVDADLARIVEEIADLIVTDSSPVTTAPVATAPGNTEPVNTVASAAVSQAFETCLSRCLSEGASTLEPQKAEVLETAIQRLRQAFLTSPLSLNTVENVFHSLADQPRLQQRICHLLREPLLQKLVRRANLQSAYEKLIFPTPHSPQSTH